MLYEAVRDNLATLLAEASEVGRGLPRYVERDFAKYLECGVLAHGFARVRCESCKDEFLVAFSCKGRGVRPSCNAKRAHVTAVHLVEQVLPHVPYRQWTLSFPHRVRWVLLKDVGLLSDVLTVFLRAVFTLQRRRARRQGLRGGFAIAHLLRVGGGQLRRVEEPNEHGLDERSSHSLSVDGSGARPVTSRWTGFLLRGLGMGWSFRGSLGKERGALRRNGTRNRLTTSVGACSSPHARGKASVAKIRGHEIVRALIRL